MRLRGKVATESSQGNVKLLMNGNQRFACERPDMETYRFAISVLEKTALITDINYDCVRHNITSTFVRGTRKAGKT